MMDQYYYAYYAVYALLYESLEISVELLDFWCQCRILDLVSLHNLGQFSLKLLQIRLVVLALALHLFQQTLDSILWVYDELLSAWLMYTFSEASSRSFQLSAKR